MKKVLLLDTSIASLNQGDEIINISIRNNCQEIFKENYIMKLPTHTPLYTPFQCFLYNKKKLNTFNEADYKFLCGTNAIYTNMLRPLPSWNINIYNYKMVRNTICLGTGLGVNSKKVNFYTKLLYKKVLSKNFIHSTRDEKTKEFLESLGLKAINTGCPTLWGLTPEFCESIPTRKSNKVIFTLTNYENDRENDQLMIDILKENYDKVYFWPQSLGDIEYLKSFSNIDNIIYVAPNIIEYDKILNDNIDYVGNRLHGGIFAMQHRCRTIIISIDYRAREMAQTYSFKCIQRDQISNMLEKLINTEWKTEIDGLDFEKIREWKKQFSDGKI